MDIFIYTYMSVYMYVIYIICNMYVIYIYTYTCVCVRGDLIYVRNTARKRYNKYVFTLIAKQAFWNCQDGKEMIDIYRMHNYLQSSISGISAHLSLFVRIRYRRFLVFIFDLIN